MAFVGRVVEFPNRITLKDENGNVLGPYTLEFSEGEVTEEGTPLTAENLNSEIEQIAKEKADEAIEGLEGAFTIDSSNNVHFRNMQAGTATIKVTKAKAVMTKNIKFSKAFTKKPYIVVAPNSSAPQNISVSFKNVTTTGFTIHLYRTTKVNTSVNWIAFV